VFPLLPVDSKNSQIPIGVVKILTEKEFFLKEIQYHQLLNRHIKFARNNQKFYIFMPFYKISLSEYNSQLKKFHNKNLVMKYPLFTPSQRLNFFIGYLEQVKVIHDNKECMGDPKSTNCMLDWDEKSIKNPTLNMIDFDGVHIKGSQEKWLHTRICLPPNLINKSSHKIGQEYDLPDDIFILGHMLAECFPEFFNVKFHNPPEDFKGQHMAATLEQVASKSREDLEFKNKLYDIICSMMDENPNLRSNIGDCIRRLSDLNSPINSSADSSDDENRSFKRRKR